MREKYDKRKKNIILVRSNERKRGWIKKIYIYKKILLQEVVNIPSSLLTSKVILKVECNTECQSTKNSGKNRIN